MSSITTQVLAIYGDYEGEDVWEMLVAEVAAAMRKSAVHDDIYGSYCNKSSTR
jgi:hypothetical protein